MINQLINSIIECEKALETIRIDINQQSLFSLKPIMERLDQQRKNHITSFDIMQFCQDNDIECNHLDAFCCINYLDINKDGLVTFEDLTIQLLTKTNRQIRFMAAMREPYFIEKQMCLPEIIETGLSYFFGELLIYLREQLQLKTELKNEEFNYFQLLQEIDKSNSGIIKFIDFMQYFDLTEQNCIYFFLSGNYNSEMSQINLLDLLKLNNPIINQQCQKIVGSPLKQNNFQCFQSIESISYSPQRKTVKQQKSQIKNVQNSIETQSNASSQFVDEITKQLQDFQITPKNKRKEQIFCNYLLLSLDKKTYLILFQLLFLCKMIKKTQIKILQRFDFTINGLFSYFDQNKNGYLIEKDFQNGFRKLGIVISENLTDIIKNYGKDNKISPTEFFQLFSYQELHNQDFISQDLSIVTIDYIRQLFQQHIEIELFKRLNFDKILKKTEVMNETNELENQIQQLFKMFKAYPNDLEIDMIKKSIIKYNS